MRILLINPPDGLHDRNYLAPPLGSLTLAQAARAAGYHVSVLDLNLEVISDPTLGGPNLYDYAYSMIARERFEVIGFTSMCLESHVSLEIARQIKTAFSEVVTIFGGTHFGSIAQEVLENFSFADFIVTGEGEDALLAILERLKTGYGELPNNVWYRENNKVAQGTIEPKRYSLDELPFPAYDLVDLQRYFKLNPDHLLNYEAGRGCVFKCSFCYSPFQYGDAVRNKQGDGVVEDLRRIVELGARHVFFVQDNFLNSPRWALEVCQQIVDANLPLTWECYATYPQLNEQIIDSLAQAGCVGIFTGIDAVSTESQRRMHKPFLKNWENTSRKLSYCRAKGILPMCAFILEGPTQPADEIDSTINTALQCINIGCEVHLNTLSLYNGTALRSSDKTRCYHYSQIKPELLLDTPEVVQSNPFAKQWPHLFPYHSTVDDVKEWQRFTARAYTLWSVMIALHQTCFQFAIEESNSLWETMTYVDDELVEIIRNTPVPKRRLDTIIRFANHFTREPLMSQTRTSLRREVARLVLSAREEARLVSLSVNNSTSDYFLGWFACLPETEFAGDILSSGMLECTSTSKSLPASDSATFELALRSQNGVIKFYALNRERLRLLLELSRVSSAGSTVTLSLNTVSQLEDEGWIWPVRLSQLSVSGLGNGVRAA